MLGVRRLPEYVPCPLCGGSGTVEAALARLVDDEQSLQEADQTASDRDQTWSDHDQTASDRDQESSDADQRASDLDAAAGGDLITHDRTAAARARSSRDRTEVAQERDQTAAERDRLAEQRDRDADARDQVEVLHDQMAREAGEGDPEEHWVRAELVRVQAAARRARAAEDRRRAADDRAFAAAERQQAEQQRAEAKHDLLRAATDDLTGAWTRKFGLEHLAREIERARRTSATLVLAFIDIDGLKDINDRYGHTEGDHLLRDVATAMRASVRPYDVIVRYGGDEFLCAMPGLAPAAAHERLDAIAAAVCSADARYSFTFGLAELEPGDGPDELISRADTALLQARGDRNHPEP
ncbi:MAG TPA: GGDEF domain-containing protein [Gaiellaceae bacterium]|nr:GGDEF domain-containing protein [Gaiellaceae bacterium]